MSKDSTSQLQKMLRTCQFLNILSCKCAPRYSGVQFFDIETSKSGPSMLCFVHFGLTNELLATTECHFATSPLPKVVRACRVLYILTYKCASRYDGVPFCDIATSKSGPSMLCFVHFDLQMCFSLERRAILRHRNFQEWPEPVSFLAF